MDGDHSGPGLLYNYLNKHCAVYQTDRGRRLLNGGVYYKLVKYTCNIWDAVQIVCFYCNLGVLQRYALFFCYL